MELAKLEKMQEKLIESLDIESSSSEDEDIEGRLADLEEATKSMDLYRTQVNQSILSLKDDSSRITDQTNQIISLQYFL